METLEICHAACCSTPSLRPCPTCRARRLPRSRGRACSLRPSARRGGARGADPARLLGRPVRVEGLRQCQRVFGGLVAGAMGPYALRGYFENGGEVAHVWRAAGPGLGTAQATWDIDSVVAARGGFQSTRYRFTASSGGSWNNELEVSARYRLRGRLETPEVDVVGALPASPPRPSAPWHRRASRRPSTPGPRSSTAARRSCGWWRKTCRRPRPERATDRPRWSGARRTCPSRTVPTTLLRSPTTAPRCRRCSTSRRWPCWPRPTCSGTSRPSTWTSW
jgi:hypothetical protein